jgi:hypothetical protein
MVNALGLSHDESIWIDYGSGSPAFGLMVSIFTKYSICLDVPEVMSAVYTILNLMIKPGDAHKHLMSGIYLVSKDILRMKIADLPKCFKDLTHFTCFIGVEEGMTNP